MSEADPPPAGAVHRPIRHDSADLHVAGSAFYVDDLPEPHVPAYVQADARLGWRLSDRLVLSLTGRNLIEDRRVETSDPLRARAFGRSVFGALQVSF